MVRPRREGFGEESNGDVSDRFNRPRDGEGSDESPEIDGSEPSVDSIGIRNNGGHSSAFPVAIGDVLRDGADANTPLGREEVENRILQWLQLLDLQVMGGCRADERLKPLLKLHASSGAAEDQFMAQLVQHFDASEVAVLARCLCIPLVSVRVGKISKQGNMLCPTAARGYLSLTLLPSSHMRISFSGDDGCIERLALVSNELESSSVFIEDISADTCGRSFLLRFPGSRILYLWCSEKSKVDGMELIVKMKDLLRRKPSLSDLTGIPKSRLDSFATYLRVYILASSSSQTAASSSSIGSLMATCDFHSSEEADFSSQSNSTSVQIPSTRAAKVYPVYQSSIIPRSNVFKDGEKVRRTGDSSIINIQPSTPPPSSHHHHHQSKSQSEGEEMETHGKHGLFLPATFTISSQFSSQSSFLSPFYCRCPPCPTTLPYCTNSLLPSASELLPLPPLSTLLSAAGPPESLVTFPLSVTELLSPLKYPGALIPEPLVRLSMPIPSLCPLASSQQFATFTPFMSDSIVHIPVIDVCSSSGQGYFVSAGGASMPAATIPSLPISHVSSHHQLITPSESPIEKSARETLRMLMASTPTFSPPKLYNVLPDVLSSMELCGRRRRSSSSVAAGDEGLFQVAVDIESITSDISSMEQYYSSSADDICEEGFNEEMDEECSCPNPKFNNCRMFNNEYESESDDI